MYLSKSKGLELGKEKEVNNLDWQYSNLIAKLLLTFSYGHTNSDNLKIFLTPHRIIHHLLNLIKLKIE